MYYTLKKTIGQKWAWVFSWFTSLYLLIRLINLISFFQFYDSYQDKEAVENMFKESSNETKLDFIKKNLINKQLLDKNDLNAASNEFNNAIHSIDGGGDSNIFIKKRSNTDSNNRTNKKSNKTDNASWFLNKLLKLSIKSNAFNNNLYWKTRFDKII